MEPGLSGRRPLLLFFKSRVTFPASFFSPWRRLSPGLLLVSREIFSECPQFHDDSLFWQRALLRLPFHPARYPSTRGRVFGTSCLLFFPRRVSCSVALSLDFPPSWQFFCLLCVLLSFCALKRMLSCQSSRRPLSILKASSFPVLCSTFPPLP